MLDANHELGQRVQDAQDELEKVEELAPREQWQAVDDAEDKVEAIEDAVSLGETTKDDVDAAQQSVAALRADADNDELAETLEEVSEILEEVDEIVDQSEPQFVARIGSQFVVFDSPDPTAEEALEAVGQETAGALVGDGTTYKDSDELPLGPEGVEVFTIQQKTGGNA